jgi:hypothetical protein
MAIEGESVDKARARSRRTGRSKPSTARLGSDLGGSGIR